MRLLTWTAFWAFLADQLTKYLVVHVMALERNSPIEVFPPFLTFIMGRNYGINFGLFANQGDVMRWALIGLALVICAMVIYWMRSETSRWSFLSAGLLIGGALGNVIDRVLYGYVADFLNMSCCGIRNPYTFNVADIAIFAGAIGLVIFTGEKKTDDAKTP
ncbi:MAG: signal peptidase II [Pseudomonadota bacterium]